MTLLLDLSGELLHSVLTGLCHEDLLRMRRTCKRLHALVSDCDEAWISAYTLQFGDVPKSFTAASSTTPWYKRFKTKYQEEKHKAQLKRNQKKLRLQSDIQRLDRESGQLRQALAKAKQRKSGVEQQLQQLQQNRKANIVVRGWQPSAVHQHYQQVVQPVPVEAPHMAESLRQALQDAEVEVACTQRSLARCSRELRACRGALKAMQG